MVVKRQRELTNSTPRDERVREVQRARDYCNKLTG